MVNKVILMGRLGADPDLKHLASGNAVCNLSVATSESWVDKNGEKQEKTEWHRVVVFGKQAESCAKYLSKGRTAHIEGKLQTRSWDHTDGTKRYATEIVANHIIFVGDKNESSSPEPDFDSKEEFPF